jgi:4-amino-4-deoxy-L-arabinose transferase-like glycosyltransferase
MIRNINRTRLLWVLFGALLAVIMLNSLNRWFDHDEFESIHTSWKILQGGEIYVDFFQHHHPLFYYLLSPVIAIVGENTATVVAIRVMMFFMLLLIFIVAYHLSKKVFNKETAIISLLLLSTSLIFITNAIEIRPDVPQTLFGLLSILLLFAFFENRSRKCLASSSFFLGISFLFLQKTLFLILLIGGLLLIEVYKRDIFNRDVLFYLSIFLLTLAPYYLYLFYTDSLHSYFIFNWTLNASLLYSFLPTDIILSSVVLNLMLWAFYLTGLLLFMKTPNQRRFAFFSLGLLVPSFFIRAPFPQTFMMAVPLIAAISAYAMHSIFQKNKNVLALLVVLSISYSAHYLVTKTSNANGGQLRKIDYVLSTADTEDFVYDGDIQFNVFREDIDFFWFSVKPGTDALATYQTMTRYDYNIYELIDKFKPKVISNYYIKNMNDERIAKHYVQSDLYEDLYIRMKE